MCESDRWFLENKYNKTFGVAYRTDSSIYTIEDEAVTIDQFTAYEKGRDFHLKRFEFADSKIVMKHNLITWLTRHYKQAKGGNPIPALREQYYKSAGAHENNEILPDESN